MRSLDSLFALGCMVLSIFFMPKLRRDDSHDAHSTGAGR
jgi:hypothetical protein